MKRLIHLRDWIFKPPYIGLPWLVWFYALIACLFYRHGGVFAGELTGFDDHTRMVQVLNWVNGAGWYDRVITRVNAPDGFQSLWTRLVDIPFAAVILLFQQFTGQRVAALIAAFIVPFVELVILFIVAPYFARPLVGKKHARLIILFLMFTSVLNYKQFSVAGFHTGEVSHHAWYIILALLLFGAVGRIAAGISSPAPARMMAFSIALLLAVGIEGFPLIAGALLMLAVIAWGFNRPLIAQQTVQALFYATSLSLLLLPLHQPPAHWFDISFAEPSLLGPILLAAALLFFIVQNFLLQYFGERNILSLVGSTVAAAVIGGVLILAFPEMLQGPAAALSPAERAMVFKEHAEAWPLYRVAFDKIDFIGLVMPSLIALGASVYALRHTRSPRRRALYIAYGGFGLLTGGIAEGIARYYHHAMTTASVWLLWAWQKIKDQLPHDRFFALKTLGVFLLLGPFWMLLLPALDQDEPLVSHVLLFPTKVQTFYDLCHSVAFGRYLNQHYTKNAVLMVPGADSSRMLFYSKLKIDFLNNYPSQNKFIDNETFFGTQDIAITEDIATRHNIDLVAVCRALADIKPLQPGEEPMFYERLQYGNVPPWLKPVQTGLPGYRLYEVDKAALRKREKNE